MALQPYNFPKLIKPEKDILIIGEVFIKNSSADLQAEYWNEEGDYSGISELFLLPPGYEEFSSLRGIKLSVKIRHTGNNKLKISLRDNKFDDLPKLVNGWTLAVFKTDLPETDTKEIFIEEILNKQVITESGTVIGTVKEVTDIPTPYPMFVVADENGNETYLPLPPEYFIDNTDTQIIVSDKIPVSFDTE